MKSLLNALQEGRLIELPECNKEKALQYLAALIEAIPDLKAGTEVTEGVLTREKSFNTGLGHGWGCPHVRTSQEGELVCAVGWSPTGIDYGSPDQQPVHLIVMYYVPDVQKNAYLKEISSLAKAITSQPSLRELGTLKDLAETRHRLLDVITLAVESSSPDAKARMIRLEAKQAAIPELPALPLDWSKQIVPLSVLIVPSAKPVILAQDKDLVVTLEQVADLGNQLARSNQIDQAGYRILSRTVTNFQPDRLLYDCLAVKLNGSTASGPAAQSPAALIK
jgi:mannitol/fructose-specific phosphotransferase system IIA component (Ntr-type)